MRHGSFQGRRNNNNNNRHRSGGQQNGPRQGNGGNSRPHRNQIFDSNGPDVRVRGTAFQINEKYLALGKDAASSGDLILAENYLQHAEHYQRLINEFEPVVNHHQQNGQDSDRHNGNQQPAQDNTDAAETNEEAAGGENGEGAEDVVRVVRREPRRAPQPAPADTDDADLGLPSTLFASQDS